MTTKRLTLHVPSGESLELRPSTLRLLWHYGLIPAGTKISNSEGVSTNIEHNSAVTSVTPRIERDAADFKGQVFMSQNFAISPAQTLYLRDLGWFLPIEQLNYYQADWLRKRLEENFPERIHPFRDPDNPWSPGSTRPMNVDSANAMQRSYLEFLGVHCDESVTLKEAESLIAQKGSEEKSAEWKAIRDSWKNLPPTDRQLQVLRFFKCLPHQMADRGAANATIAQIFRSEANRQEWDEYKRNDSLRQGGSRLDQ